MGGLGSARQQCLQAAAHGDDVTVDQVGRWSRQAAEFEPGLPRGSLNPRG